MACSRFYRHPIFGVIQQVQVNTACKPRSLNLKLLFRGRPRGRGKCPLNIGVPWVEVGVGPFISNLPTKKINIFLICPGIFTQPAVITLRG